MTSLTYFVESVPWLVVGLIGGFVLGRSTVALSAIADAAQRRDNEGGSMSDVETGSVSKPVKQRRFSLIHVIGLALIGLSVFSAIQDNAQDEATARLTECQLAYADGFADALDARSKASLESQEALDAWMTRVNAVIQAPSPQAAEEIRKAFTEYLEARREAKETQKTNPYPDPPRDVCKEN